ncbi:hypothetical protein [Fluviicola sp.]|uniref:hypothetical protein n=1 Tax=Fluviicola sp. TaxID=1917219 RepID=UPI003D2D152A
MKNKFTLGLVLLTHISIAQTSEKPKSDSIRIPFDGIDVSWQNGSDRRTESIWKDNAIFTPSVMIDVNYTYSFNNPNDNTVVGSTALAKQ